MFFEAIHFFLHLNAIYIFFKFESKWQESDLYGTNPKSSSEMLLNVLDNSQPYFWRFNTHGVGICSGYVLLIIFTIS